VKRSQQLVAEGQKLQYPKSPRPAGRAERLRRAIEKYTEAIELDPRYIGAFIWRAAARRQLGDLEGARADAMVAYRIGSDDPNDYLLISAPFPGATRRRILRKGIAKARFGSFEHFYLGADLARTYWYEGRFDLQVRATVRLIRQLEESERPRSLEPLHYEAGTALMAMDRYVAAERHLRAAFSDRTSIGMLARAAVVECRICRDDLDGASQVLEQVAAGLGPSLATLTRAYLRALGSEPLIVPKGLMRRLLAQKGSSRDDYMGAVVLHRLGRKRVAEPRLRRFIGHCESNPSEWGVTLRWEIAKAKSLLA
jgi:tetratricopeptide (TPR) repeat protein